MLKETAAGELGTPHVLLSSVIASLVLVGLQFVFVTIHALPSFTVRSRQLREGLMVGGAEEAEVMVVCRPSSGVCACGGP
jgi:hypothetical protein